MKNHLLGFLLPLLVLPYLAHAQTYATASDALAAMNVPAGAKATALGGAFSAWSDDTSAIYWNPAGMVYLPKIQIQTAYNQWFQDTFFQDLAGVYPMDWGALGLRLSYINLGSIVGRDGSGTADGTTITPEAWGGTFAAAGRLGNFSLGLAAKSYFELLSTYNDGGLAMDVGGLYQWGFLDVSAGIRNIALVTSYNFPTEYYTGLSLRLGSQDLAFHLATDTTFTDGGLVIHHGLEIGYRQTIFLRAGYQWISQPLPDENQAGLSGGAGIALNDWMLDYSIASYGDLGLTNRLSLGYQFTLPTPTPTPNYSRGPIVDESRGDMTQPILPPTSTPLPTPGITATPATLITPSPLTMREAYHIGIAAYRDHDYEKAAEYLKKATTFPYSISESIYMAEANSMLGIIYQFYLTGPESFHLARRYYQAALRIDPSNATALRHLPQVEPNDSDHALP